MSHNPETRRGDGVKTFLDRLYWTLGLFLLFWSALAVTGILRRTILEFPIIGKTQVTESIIFTQIVIAVLMPCLLYVIATYRAAAALRKWPSRFPGAPEGDFEIPPSFSWLRVGIFIGLVILPISAFWFCFDRMVRDLRIEWIGKNPTTLEHRKLFTSPPRPDPTADYSNWRWRGFDVTGETPESKMSAAPGFEPWGFALSGTACSVTALWFLFIPAGSFRRKINWQRAANRPPDHTDKAYRKHPHSKE